MGRNSNMEISASLSRDILNASFKNISTCDRIDIVNEPMESTRMIGDLAPHLGNSVFHASLTPDSFAMDVDAKKIFFIENLRTVFDKGFCLEYLYFLLSCRGDIMFSCRVDLPNKYAVLKDSLSIQPCEIFTIDF